jgi:predicted DNA-binding transcriptional regulator YafY
VPRNQEVIRQWKVLHALDSSRQGMSIDTMARDLEVTTRTIRRDLAALQEAGFPLYDEKDEHGRTRWYLDGQVLKGLETGMRTFLDQMPAILTAKKGPRASVSGEQGEVATQLLEAALHHRVARMRYHSVSSRRVKDYVIHPERLAFAQGELYLLAYVPEYRDTRTFAFTRITSVSLEKQTFTPRPDPDGDVFANSLGVHTGPTAPVEIQFDARVAPYVRARVWHPSQRVVEANGGDLHVSMEVCHDWALRSWILSWGPLAKVVSPAVLAREIRDELNAASTRYSSR